MINAPTKYGYNFVKKTNRIEKYPHESGSALYANMMALRKGYPGKLKVTVHEVQENFIDANGNKDTAFKIYDTTSSIAPKSLNVFQGESDDDALFEGQVNFHFG